MRRGGDPIDFTGNPVAVIDLGSINELSAFLVRVQLGTRELFFGGKKKTLGRFGGGQNNRFRFLDRFFISPP